MEDLKKRFNEFKNHFYIESGLTFASQTLLNGIFLVGFGLALGADDFQLGLLLALPLFANLLQLVSAYILEASGTKKYTSIFSLLAGRFIWIIVIAMAFGFIKSDNPILLFALILLISNIFIAVGNLSILSWIKDIVPVDNLARFLGKRNIYSSVGGIIVYIIGSLIIDLFGSIEIYGVIYAIAIIIGLIGLFFLDRVSENQERIKAINPIKFIKRLKVPFKDKNFRPLLYFGLLWGFAINLGAPFFLVFMLDDLAIGFFIVSLFLVIEAISKIYGLSIWRRLADRFGAKPILIVTATVTSLVPLAFVFINKSNFYLIPVIFLISSISYAGVDIAIAQLLFKSAPRKIDAYYLSAFTSFVGIFSALGPILGGLLSVTIAKLNVIQMIPSLPVIGGLTPIKYVFIISAILRISCLPMLRNIVEYEAKEVNDILDRVKELRFVSFFVNIYSFADFTSKFVLVPQKQLFILQKKTVTRMEKDVVNTMNVLSQVTKELNKKAIKNVKQHNRKVRELAKDLGQLSRQLNYLEGTKFHKIPKQINGQLNNIMKKIHNKEMKFISEETKRYCKSFMDKKERLRCEFNKELNKSIQNRRT